MPPMRGLSLYLGGDPCGKGTCLERSEASPAAGTAAILDTYTTTSHNRKLSRLYHRLTELEYLHPDLLQRACFITLTCRYAETAETVRTAWHRVQAYLMRHGYIDYVVTSAIQGKRFKTYGDAVVHYHVIVFGHRRVSAVDIRRTWGLGATFHVSAKNTTHAIRYVASYVRGNVGRLSWSTHLLSRVPGGAAPHTNCFRYVTLPRGVSSVSTGNLGAVVNFGWGGVVPVRQGYSYVPALGRVVPSVATTNHTLLWVAYRMSIDWSEVRERAENVIEAERRFIERFRREPVDYLQAVGRLFANRPAAILDTAT